MSSTLALIFITVAVLFILGMKFLSSPKTARYGNLLAAFGMLVALVATVPLLGKEEASLLKHGWSLNYTLMAVGILIGLALGAVGAYSVKMTAMPQMVAAFNGLGGGSAALVASLEFFRRAQNHDITAFVAVTMLFATLIGSLSFSGSIIAFLKLEGRFEKPHTFPGQNFLNGLILAVILGLCVYLAGWVATNPTAFMVMFLLALVFGVAMVMPIGGADMPVVISLLNAFTGTAVAMAGFVIANWALIVAGALVGASGSILTKLMADAMNRSLANIIIGGFGTGDTAAAIGGPVDAHVRSIAADDAAIQLAYASKVIIVPGYGLAAAQAQHGVAELAKVLEDHGVEVSYAIHPVAGRMPGHMNVLLAEANVPYPQLKEMDEINPEFARTDVALVIGANDVTNPAARRPGNEISGMPILDVDQAKSVIVVKRSMGHGYAGLENELYYDPKTSMYFSDAKKAMAELTAAVKTLVG